MSAIPLSRLASSGRWQADFLQVMPTVERHAAIRFRWLPPDRRAEAVAEAIGQAFVAYGDLARKKKLSCAFRGSLADFAVRSVIQCRHVGGHQSCRDVMSGLTQKRGRATVCSLTSWDRQEGKWREAVLEDRRVSPADQAVFNLDFEDWLKRWPQRHCQIITALGMGSSTKVVAERFRITPGRVSQLRRRYEHSWLVFQGMVPASVAA